MKRRWSVTEGIFERDDGPWWLKKEYNDRNERMRTPMTVALKNGDISRVIDVKLHGLSSYRKREGIF